MKRKLLCVFVLLVSLTAAVCAHAAPERVVDNSGLLSSQESAALTSLIGDISAEHGIDIVVLTVDSLDGKSAMDYADDFYDYGGYGDDGVLLLVCMQARVWWISTSGSCIRTIDNSVIDTLSEQFTPYLSRGDYYGAFRVFIQGCGSAVTESAAVSFKSILICLGIGAVIGLIVVLCLKAQLKSIRPQTNAGCYVRSGSMQVTVSRDMFLYQNVTRRLKPQNNSSGGTHRGSSGRSHGGGGGRF